MEEINKEIVEKIKTLPKWITEPLEPNDKGEFIWKVDCFGEVFELKELTGAGYEAASAFAEKTGWDEIQVLLQRSIVGVGALELDKLRGRKYMRLKSALTYVYGMNDF